VAAMSEARRMRRGGSVNIENREHEDK